MTWKEAIAFRRLLLIYCLSASSMIDAVSSCVVHPKDVVAAAGERVSLNCSTTAGLYVGSWQKGADISKKIVIYTAPVYRSDGSIRTQRFIADGYSVDDPKESQAVLHINSIVLSQAESYYCTCSDRSLSTASATVAVIEPKLSTNSSVCNGEPVTINCRISSSEGISYVISIKDSHGNTVARKNNSSSCNEALSSCQLNYTFTANTSVNESYRCTVNVTTSKNIRFSKVLHSSIDYSDDCPGQSESQNGAEGSDACQVLAFQIAIAVACVIIAILSATTILLYRKLKQRNAIDALKISTEDSPTIYAALDAQTASDERQREAYTAIHLPNKSQQVPRGDRMTTNISSAYETVT